MTKALNILLVSLTFQVLVKGFQTGVVRLKGGNGPYEGRVEIFMNGQWGTVDDDPWDDNDAGVVCRQLGYIYGGRGFRSAHFGEGSGPIWLDSIGCIGSETNLLACPHETDTNEDSHAEDVGVACNGEIRLVGGSHDYEGRVEILLNGQWGTIDEDPWENDDANVVCRQLGYPFGGVAYKSAHFGEGSGPIWLDDINCHGNETHFLQCSYGLDTSEDSHAEDVGVSCNTIAIDPCDYRPCENNGSCINNRKEYICICPSGFEGHRCETVIDPCENHPCKHNGLCINENNQYLCICPDGFQGRRCESDIDPCESEECTSRGDCVQRLNHRYCSCENTLNETIICKYDINPCFSSPCKESEECLSEGSHFECVIARNSGTRTSYLPLIVAICALLVAVICLVKVTMMSRNIKHQRYPSTPVINNDRVQMSIQPNQYGREEVLFDGCNKQQQVTSYPMAPSDNSDDQDVYENY